MLKVPTKIEKYKKEINNYVNVLKNKIEQNKKYQELMGTENFIDIQFKIEYINKFVKIIESKNTNINRKIVAILPLGPIYLKEHDQFSIVGKKEKLMNITFSIKKDISNLEKILEKLDAENKFSNQVKKTKQIKPF